MRTTQQLRDAWAPACKIRRATFTFWTGVAVTVDERILPALHALDDVLRRHGYAPKDGQTWGFACRAITGGTGYSLHAYGIAVDINSVSNPYGRTLVTDMPRGMVDDILAIRTVAGLQVWRWGGDYGGNKDAMHFEIVASPAELAAGIAHPPAPHPSNPGVKVPNHVASLAAPNGGIWHLAADGGIFTQALDDGLPEAPYYGSVPEVGGLPAGLAVKGLVPDHGGYAVVVSHPDSTISFYRFPAK